MKRLIYLLLAIVPIISCNESESRIEVIEDFDKIYLSEDKVDKHAVPLKDNNKELRNDLKRILKELHGNETKKIFYPISYKVYINKSGKIDKIMDYNQFMIDYLIGMVDKKNNLPDSSIYKDLDSTKIYRDVKKTTKMLLPFFEKIKFSPALLGGKAVSSKTNVQTIGIVDENREATFEVSFLNGSPMFPKFSSSKDIETYFVAVEEMPSPIGGMKAIQEKIKYPESAKKAGIEGRVFVKAFIDENGNVASAEIIKGTEESLDKAALDAVKLTKFEPGRQRGKTVKVQVTIPIMFKLQ
jgi:TonB family protein